MKSIFITFLLISTVYSFNIFDRINFRRKRADSISDSEAARYLQKFGYIKPSDLIQKTSSVSSENDQHFKEGSEIRENAVKEFQEFAGLKPTGELDNETKEKMSEPRCGVADIKNLRISSYLPWKNNEITYAILNFSPDLSSTDTKNAIRRAFDIWSTEIPRTFREVSSTDLTANIKLEFGVLQHGDPWPFDGEGGILAHGATNGILHFDDDEVWKRYERSEKVYENIHDLLSVALHEIGHVLGLDHTRIKGSVMAPFYLNPIDDNGKYIEPKLLLSDIKDVQEIYGEKIVKSNEESIESEYSTSESPTTDSEGLQPNDCPIPQKNKDIAVSDIKSVKGLITDCCDICKITSKCKAYSWNDWEGGTCWLKSATGPVIDLYGVSLGIL
uniref:Peptidase metallopeptidase domain-containing protein n=1 Tax=Panagrolaimus davidi TaxID=227884 RepID=A0A914Q1M8_9BILA